MKRLVEKLVPFVLVLALLMSCCAFALGEAADGAEEAAKLLEDIKGTYEPPFPVITRPEYDQIWLDPCVAAMGEEAGPGVAETLKAACSGTIYGQEAIDAYGDGSNGAQFDCLFINGVSTITFDGSRISGKDEKAPERAPQLSLLLLTLLTGGCGDVMIKIYEEVGNSAEGTVFFFYLFATAALLTSVLAFWEFRRSGRKLLLKEMAAGIAVGIPNYFSSFLILQVLQVLPAFVTYSVYSTGTILLVLVMSALLFREKPGRRQLYGIVLILAALVLLNL